MRWLGRATAVCFLSAGSAALLSWLVVIPASCRPKEEPAGLPKTDKELVRLYLETYVPASRQDGEPPEPTVSRTALRLAIRKKGDAILEEFICQYLKLSERRKAVYLGEANWPIPTARAFRFITGEIGDEITEKSLRAGMLLGLYRFRPARPRIRALYDKAMKMYVANTPRPGQPWQGMMSKRHAAAEDALSRLGTALIELGDLEPVLEKVRRLLQDSDEMTTLLPFDYSGVAQEIAIAGKGLMCAGPVMDRVLETDPGEMLLYNYYRYYLNRAIGIAGPDFFDPAEAIKWCSGPRGKSARHKSWVSLSSLAYRYRDHKLALLCCTKALGFVPGDPGASCVKACVLRRLGRSKEALTISARLIAKDPKDKQARLLRARIHIDEGNLRAARRELDPLREGAATDRQVLALSKLLEAKSGDVEESRRLAGELAESMLSAELKKLEGLADSDSSLQRIRKKAPTK